MGQREAWARLQASGLTALEGSVLLYELTYCRQMGVALSGTSRGRFRKASIDPDDIKPPEPGGGPTPGVLGPAPPVRPALGARRVPRSGGGRGEGAA